MSESPKVSVIIPFYNAQKFLKNCLRSLVRQDFQFFFEVIMIDDASTDDSKKIVNQSNLPNLKLFHSKINGGPAVARNIGIDHARGEYIFFLDVDDTISKSCLKTLYNEAKDGNFDLVLGDKQLIKDNKRQRINYYAYDAEKVFNQNEITNEIKKRIYDPSYSHGLIGVTGRLIKNSIVIKNNLKFQNSLRYLEDETFSWDILSFCNKIRYIRKRLYNYYVHTNFNSGISDGISRGFSIQNYKTLKKHVFNCFLKRNLSNENSLKLADQAFIFSIISSLISYSRSIILGKVDISEGRKKRKKLIEDILNDRDVHKAVKNYLHSKSENKWIPLAIRWKSKILLEFMCDRRVKEILNTRGY
jgi:glycosyltransferase involved in cell wall biosynthesis